MPPAPRDVAQRVVGVHLAPVLQWAAVVEVRACDGTVRVRRVGVAPAAVPAVEVPVRVGTEEGPVAASDDFGEGGAVAGRAGAPYLDDGVGGQRQVEVEDVFFPDDWGQGVGVDDRDGVVDEGLQVGG